LSRDAVPFTAREEVVAVEVLHLLAEAEALAERNAERREKESKEGEGHPDWPKRESHGRSSGDRRMSHAAESCLDGEKSGNPRYGERSAFLQLTSHAKHLGRSHEAYLVVSGLS